MRRTRRTIRISLLAAVLAACCLASSTASSIGTAEELGPFDERLAPELVASITESPAEAVDVWIIFSEQPAVAAAPALRADYTARIDEVRAPARAALARIRTLLPSREDRIELGVAGLMEREVALLYPEERAVLRSSRDETVRLVREMRSEILEAAAPRCERLQDPLRRYVESLPSGSVLGSSNVLNSVFARVRPADLPALVAAFPTIGRVDASPTLTVSMDKSVGAIGASSFTSPGYNGSGQSVAIGDTGIDTSHPAFSLGGGGNVVTASTVQLAIAAVQSNFNDNASSTDDLHGHGTHLCGTVASQDSTYGGVAPGTGVLNAKCFYRTTSNQGSGTGPDIAAATDWAITNGATVFNGSFGGGGTSNGNSGFSVYFDAAVEVSGMSVAIAAGNSGPNSGTIGLPGDAFNIVTVGAFNDRNTTSGSDDAIASFSSRGNTSDGRRKPDLSAPGVSIQSASWIWETANDFRSSNGTSMATPHVAGAMALLLDYNAAWQPEAVKALLINSVRNSSPVPRHRGRRGASVPWILRRPTPIATTSRPGRSRAAVTTTSSSRCPE